MADWSQLPNELLHLISKRLGTCYDVICFRSVCSTWRWAATPPERHRLSLRYPADDGITGESSGYPFTKRTIFLIRTSKTNIQKHPSASWVVQIQEFDAPNKRVEFLDPLSCSYFLPHYFPKALNLLDFRVLELGQEYVFYSSGPEIVDPDMVSRMGKVALYCLDGNANNDFVILSILAPSEKLAMFKSSDKKWTIIEDTPYCYDDVILYKDKLYAVDVRGRTVVVGLDSETRVVAVPLYGGGGKEKFLVESKGVLLLVDMYPSFEVEDEMCSCSWTGKFKVFKLDEVGKKWIKVKDLEDVVLFLGPDSTFAATAKDLSLCRGNCIVFANCFNYYLHGEGVKRSSVGWDICVFDLENCSTGPLWKFPQFGKLFMPPYSWSSSRTVNVNKTWKIWKASIMERIDRCRIIPSVV